MTVKDLEAGQLYRNGLLSKNDIEVSANLLAQIDTDKIETIRVVFADAHGILRGKTITAAAAGSIFTSGIRIPSTLLLKDTSHRTVFPVWSADGNTPMRGANDLLLCPRPETFMRLPWSPHSALLHCDICMPDASPVSFSSRQVLRIAVDKLAEKNLNAIMGLEVEFQIFEVTDDAKAHEDTSMPARPPETRSLNQGYQYLTETRYDEAEFILDKIRRHAEASGMPVQSVEIEMGPSQFEMTFAPSDPMGIADMAVNFRTLVKEVCAREGLLASFMAKPKLANAAANGWHIHQSVVDAKTGANCFISNSDGTHSTLAGNWIAGLLEHAAASCLMTTPTVNGYKRFTEFQLAPNRIGWGEDNRGAMIRALLSAENTASRVENRVADSTANPYFALASQIASGLDGINCNLQTPPALENPYDPSVARLPASLSAAIDAFESSSLYADMFGSEFVGYLTKLKRAEWDRYVMTISEWEQAEYFSLF